MGRLVTIHSFRGGTGKSNFAANLAWLSAGVGARVAELDTNLQSPGVHVVFGTETERIFSTLSDFVSGRCEFDEVAIGLTDAVDADDAGGRPFLLPSSMQLEAITRILPDGCDVGEVNRELVGLMERLELDHVVLDTHPGLNRETMLSAALSESMVIVVGPDQQDYQGTAVLVELTERLGVPSVVIVVDKVMDEFDPIQVRDRIERAFGLPVVGVLPLAPEMMRVGSRGIFAVMHPSPPPTPGLQEIAERLLRRVREAAGDAS